MSAFVMPVVMAFKGGCKTLTCQKREAIYIGGDGQPPPITVGGENFARTFYGTIGGPPTNCIAAMFAALMQGSYFYLVGFITQAIIVIVAIFWGPFAAIVLNNPDVAIKGATSILDALAVTFAGFFAVPSGYVCTTPGAVLLLTATNAIGKLAVASPVAVPRNT